MSRDFQAFPVKLLPNPVRAYVTEGAASMRCDPSYVALPLLSAVAGAIGNSRRIMLKRGWTEPAVLWTAVVGNSGTTKSPAFRLALRPVYGRQKRLARDFNRELASYKQAVAEWKSADKDNRCDAPEQPAPMEHCIINDATVEAIADRLECSPRGVLLAADELSQIISGMNQYRAKGGNDREKLLSMHGADYLKIDRKTGDKRTIIVPFAAVSIAGGTQPKILRRVFRAEHFDSGFVARYLMAMPPAQAALWTDNVVSDATLNAIDAMFDVLYQLAGTPGSDGEAFPADVPLSSDAQAEWIQFQNVHATEQVALADDDDQAAWAKLRGYAARLALVIHCVRQAAGEPVDAWRIDVDSIRAGIGMEGWFRQEAKRVYDLFASDPEESDRDALIGWIERRGGSITVRDLRNDGPRKYRAPGAAEATLQDLADLGIGKLAHRRQVGRGRPGSVVFTVNGGGDQSRGVNNAGVKNTLGAIANGNIDADATDAVSNNGRKAVFEL
jgi:hypothetical protein